jgi:AcrR family transcriptional regulator
VTDEGRERIVAGAYRALVKHGYHQTSMKDIAEETDVAPGLAHYYFETKEDLLVAAIQYGCQPVMKGWLEGALDTGGQVRPGVDAEALARLGFEAAKEDLRRHRDLFALSFDMYGAGLHNPKIATAVKAFIDGWRAQVTAVAQAVVAVMPEPPRSEAEAIAAAVWGSLNGIYLQKLSDPQFDADAAIDALAEMVFTFSRAGAHFTGGVR